MRRSHRIAETDQAVHPQGANLHHAGERLDVGVDVGDDGDAHGVSLSRPFPFRVVSRVIEVPDPVLGIGRDLYELEPHARGCAVVGLAAPYDHRLRLELSVFAKG